MVTAIIIDYDQKSSEILQKLICRYFDKKVIILDTCNSIKKGSVSINHYKPEIVFLEIQMLSEDAFELFKYFDTIDFQVVFTTSQKNFTLSDIKHFAFDYLLKPINQMELLGTIKRFESHRENFKRQEKLLLLLENLNTDAAASIKIALPTQSGYDFQKLSHIMYCQSDGNYCKIKCIDGKKLFLSKTLKHIENLINSKLFFRIHKSYLVNLNFITKFDKMDSLNVTLTNGEQLPVSVRKKESFLNAILNK